MDYYYIWFFIIAVVFTRFGYTWGSSKSTRSAIEYTIDNLMKSGYLRYRRNRDGEVEILKYDETS